MLIALVIPSVLGKTLIFYFGSLYTKFPGDGYGYALSAALFFTAFNLLRFIWKYRDYKDE